MEMGVEAVEYFSAFMAKEHENLRKISGRRRRQQARNDYASLAGIIDAITVVPEGVAAAVDHPFANTGTLPPSELIKVQLRLAVHYVQSADEADAPTLSSFVVLRAAIECIATAHWLMSASNNREAVERALKRMWWDTMNAADMVTTADEDYEPTAALDDLRARIAAITKPVKRLDVETITTSERVKLSSLVEDASRQLHPDEPTQLYSTWKVCAAVSHGNLPVSAGAGISAELIQRPSQHPIDEPVYAQLLSVTVTNLRTTVELLRSRATQQHSHLRPHPDPNRR